ncbi:HAD hydrolase-like protein [Alicyclobacillus fastidiosus]|uniref:HAD hydrolase-like protein n=1 Tax=Alicyclobacillus fastidiosus TaxID=392011 RepID=A0ABY6ZC40_9BACL|nr:HAD hydrolase-like protein [Alicyclobacillus fastidiosus]WAH40463.1 HAD hydrolase-like protein [Alicyclobacillus fastidiosus]GMA61866.1 haloacid dehalogenase [Alicyclobacillus fastidiosus]
MFTDVLFDIDGVMLSEERYFDASALTVNELLTSSRFLGLQSVAGAYRADLSNDDIAAVRQAVFQRDTVLEKLKNVGVNANWDMVYLVFVSELAHVLGSCEAVPQFKRAVVDALRDGWSVAAIQSLGSAIRQDAQQQVVSYDHYDHLYGGATTRDELFDRARTVFATAFGLELDDHALWIIGQEAFQEWYLGDDYTRASTGKKGFLTSEIPLVQPAQFQSLLSDLLDRKIHLGIATGRPFTETKVPLEFFGWWKFFDEAKVSTASDVLFAEQQVPEARPLSKPHPFSYLRSLTANHDPAALLSTSLPLEGKRAQVLIVGDSIADALAAQRLGASFAAVLTGLEGVAARPKFEQLNADFILEDALQVSALFT